MFILTPHVREDLCDDKVNNVSCEILIRRRNRNCCRKRTCSAVNCCVCGNHISNNFRIIGSTLLTQHVDDPQFLFLGKYVAALANIALVTVGRLLRFKLKLAHFFVKYFGEISCEVTGSKVLQK